MTTQKPDKPISDVPDGTDGRILTPDKTGDSADWIEIAKNGDYSLIIRKDFINTYNNASRYGDPAWQYTYFGPNTKYNGSEVQNKINSWFAGTAAAAADNLSANARMRNYTVKNTALNEIGSGTIPAGINDGFSKPVNEPDRAGLNVAFALSYGEAANFISQSYSWDGGQSAASNGIAKSNFAKLRIPSGSKAYDSFWLRSPGNQTVSPFTASELDSTGRVFQKYIDGFGGEYGLVYPAVWVQTTIFD